MSKGFSEARSAFIAAPSDLVGQVRRFGPMGPAYEILKLATAADLVISVIESGETLTYSVAEALADPIAVTVP